MYSLQYSTGAILDTDVHKVNNIKKSRGGGGVNTHRDYETGPTLKCRPVIVLDLNIIFLVLEFKILQH